MYGLSRLYLFVVDCLNKNHLIFPASWSLQYIYVYVCGNWFTIKTSSCAACELKYSYITMEPPFNCLIVLIKKIFNILMLYLKLGQIFWNNIAIPYCSFKPVYFAMAISPFIDWLKHWPQASIFNLFKGEIKALEKWVRFPKHTWN